MVNADSNTLVAGALAGLGAALIGAAIWAVVTVTTGYQIGWMAVGVGFLVGMAVRQFGRGSTPAYGVVGAVLALAGCVIGNALALVGFYASENSEPFFSVLMQVDPPSLANAMIGTASAMDFLFYAIAVYEGFKLSVVSAQPAPVTKAGQGT